LQRIGRTLSALVRNYGHVLFEFYAANFCI